MWRSSKNSFYSKKIEFEKLEIPREEILFLKTLVKEKLLFFMGYRSKIIYLKNSINFNRL